MLERSGDCSLQQRSMFHPCFSGLSQVVYFRAATEYTCCYGSAGASAGCSEAMTVNNNEKAGLR